MIGFCNSCIKILSTPCITYCTVDAARYSGECVSRVELGVYIPLVLASIV